MITLNASTTTYNVFLAAVQAHQHELVQILENHGPLSTAAISYYFEHEYAVMIDERTVGDFIGLAQGQGVPLQLRIDGDGIVYHLPGQEQIKASIPVQVDYGRAYVELYLRYQAVRNDPELLAMADDYIDALYKPRRTTDPGGAGS